MWNFFLLVLLFLVKVKVIFCFFFNLCYSFIFLVSDNCGLRWEIIFIMLCFKVLKWKDWFCFFVKFMFFFCYWLNNWCNGICCVVNILRFLCKVKINLFVCRVMVVLIEMVFCLMFENYLFIFFLCKSLSIFFLIILGCKRLKYNCCKVLLVRFFWLKVIEDFVFVVIGGLLLI